MTNIFKLVLERQKSMFGHVARFPRRDPAHQILYSENGVGETPTHVAEANERVLCGNRYYPRAGLGPSQEGPGSFPGYRQAAATHLDDARSPK